MGKEVRNTVKVGESFVTKIIKLRGDRGKNWIKNLPSIVERYANLWKLKIFPPFNLSYNYVCPAEREDGSRAVLKIGFSDDKEFRSEYEALMIFNSKGVVKLLEAHPLNCAMLLERLDPGINLKSVITEDKAMQIAADLIKRIAKLPPKSRRFPTITDWSNKLRLPINDPLNSISPNLINRAKNIFEKLETNTLNKFLIHGDLHYKNILSSQREKWLAIDPKGVVGDLAYETGSLLRSNFPKSKDEIKQILSRRISLLSHGLGINQRRIRLWGFAQAVLAAVWRLEDNSEIVEPLLTYARILDGINY